MVLAVSTDYSQKLNQNQRSPCFIIRFDDDDSVQFSSQAVRAYSRTTLQYLNVPAGMGQAVDLRRLRTTISAISFELADRDQVITALIKSLQDASDASPSTKTPMLNQPITLLMGFIDIDESQFTTWVANIDDYGWTGTGWSFKARDKQRFTQQKIFKSELTTLDGGINDSVTTLTLTSGSGFSEGTYIRIDDEVILLGDDSGTPTFTGTVWEYDFSSSSDIMLHTISSAFQCGGREEP